MVTEHVQLLAMEQNRLNDEVNKKENKVEAQRIIKETEILKDKNSFIESELKVAYHKIEKMEILNEKAERMQAKKEVEIFKEIEERVKKEIKSNLTSPIVQQLPNIASGLSNNLRDTQSRYSVTGSIIDKANFEPTQYQVEQEHRRGSVIVEASNG